MTLLNLYRVWKLIIEVSGESYGMVFRRITFKERNRNERKSYMRRE